MTRYYGLYARHREKDRTLHKAVHKSKRILLLQYTQWRNNMILSFGYDRLECPSCKRKMQFVELYFKHQHVPLEELYERAMAKARCRSA